MSDKPSNSDTNSLPYDLKSLPRESMPFYIGADHSDQQKMLESLELTSLDQLFNHIDKNDCFEQAPDIGKHLEYQELKTHLETIANKNNIYPSFLGDGLKAFRPDPIISKIADIRGLTTAYTPYQPERSQGTLYTLWFYSSCISKLTGFEAINASLYERSTCLYEAIQTAKRLHKKGSIALIPESIYPQDIKVLRTLAQYTDTQIQMLTLDPKTSRIDLQKLEELLKSNPDAYSSLVFPQINNYGVLERVDELTDLATKYGIKSIAMIDPLTLGENGLKPPSQYGENKLGCSMIVAEGQHLAIDPNFGGPGLGVFGIRYNENDKISIRSSAGRYIGKTIDQKGNACLSMVLSTREQHIRREKATSNICSNQSFVASLAGANILRLGSKGLDQKFQAACEKALLAAKKLTALDGIKMAFDAPIANELCLEVNSNVAQLISTASKENKLHIGVDASNRLSNQNQYLLMSFYDHHTDEDIAALISFFEKHFKSTEPLENTAQENLKISTEFKRSDSTGTLIPSFSESDLVSYYKKLGDLNFSPDDNLYPLGSCTMKYNPYINDYAAGLTGFTLTHPQAPEEDVQGSLQILFETQEMFKKITGLAGVTTQPVAGAQGELVGLKLFQAYHADRGEAEQRDIILIPKSAHGTNPATATMAGFMTGKIDGRPRGIINIDACDDGQMNIEQINLIVEQYGKHIAGIMVTNPNTAGIFESRFSEMAKIIHKAGGLVYMDGANMNAIASWVNLQKLGVDAVHNNLHKTWTIPHGGGGPGDAIVAVSEKLCPYLPGDIFFQSESGKYFSQKAPKSIGEFHRHAGNFAHKVRCYTYLKALGTEGVQAMSANAVLSARYLFQQLQNIFPFLPAKAADVPRMHEFIITLDENMFSLLAEAGTPKSKAVAQVGKLFLDFGMHPPTVAFPEVYGLMIEPTESFSKKELDRFLDVLKAIRNIIVEGPKLAASAPHRTPIFRVDEVYANKNLQFFDEIKAPLPSLPEQFTEVTDFNLKSVQTLRRELQNELH